MTLDASGFGLATGAACRCSRQSGAQGYAVVRRVDLIDDVETIEKSKRVQWDQQAQYRELFRHPQIWERQAAIACRSRSLCLISAYSIPAGAHKRTKNPFFFGDPRTYRTDSLSGRGQEGSGNGSNAPNKLARYGRPMRSQGNSPLRQPLKILYGKAATCGCGPSGYAAPLASAFPRPCCAPPSARFPA